MSTPSQPLRKTNNRWKWMAGATVAAAGASTAPQAEAATITLIDNYYDHVINSLNADLTGDGIDDVLFQPSRTTQSFNSSSASRLYGYVRVVVRSLAFNTQLGLGAASFRRTRFYSYGSPVVLERAFAAAGLGAFASQTGSVNFTSQQVSRLVQIPVNFTDANINGGAPTNGFLELQAIAHLGQTMGQGLVPSFARVQLNQLTYDEVEVVPEPSSLALLALGGAGVIARRRRKNAS